MQDKPIDNETKELLDEIRAAIEWMEAECDDAIKETRDGQLLMFPFRDKCRQLIDRMKMVIHD